MVLSFLSPLFLIGALGIAVPIVLHLLKREAAPSVPFSAVRFLKRAPIEQTRRRRLRELLLLALRVSALLLAAVAFARPFLVAGVATTASVSVVAVDTSFSMGGPGRFEQARALAIDAIDRAGSGDLVAVVAFDDGATVVLEPVAERELARQAVRKLSPSSGGTKYGAALAQAAVLIGHRRGTVIVVTDLQRRGWAEDRQGSLRPQIAVEVRDIGAPPANLAVTAIHRDAGQTVATIASSGATPIASRVRVAVDGRVVSDVAFEAEPLVSTDVRLPVLPPAGAVSVTVLDRTGVPADDTRFLVADPAPPLRVLVVAGGEADPFYVERALAAGAGSFAVTTRTGNDLSSMSPEEMAAHTAIVLLTTRNVERKDRDAIAAFVAQGGGLLVGAGGEVDGSVLNGVLDGNGQIRLTDAEAGETDLRLLPADPRHPVFRPLGAFAAQLGRARFRRVRTLEEPAGMRVLARFSGGTPAIAEFASGAGRVMVFASDLSRRGNDLPLQPVFVPFLHETIRHLGSGRETPVEFVVAEAPPGLSREPGVQRLPDSGRRVAINVDVGESDVERMTAAEFAGAISRMNSAGAQEARGDAREAEAQQNYWRYGLMLMLAALVAEGVLGSRLS